METELSKRLADHLDRLAINYIDGFFHHIDIGADPGPQEGSIDLSTLAGFRKTSNEVLVQVYWAQDPLNPNIQSIQLGGYPQITIPTYWPFNWTQYETPFPTNYYTKHWQGWIPLYLGLPGTPVWKDMLAQKDSKAAWELFPKTFSYRYFGPGECRIIFLADKLSPLKGIAI